MKLLCWLGFHKWRYWIQYHYNEDRRWCLRCGKHQKYQRLVNVGGDFSEWENI